MKIEHARIIVELMTNAGYLDDADELVADRIENDPEGVEEFVSNFDTLITEVNAALPKDEQITLSLQEEYNEQTK